VQPPHVESAPVTTAQSKSQSDHDDYTGLPAWYVRQLLQPYLRGISQAERCTMSEAATKLVKVRARPDEFERTRNYLNYLILGKIKLVHLRKAVELLDLVGLPHTAARDDMWIPSYGLRPPIRMAGDELFAANVPVTRDSLAARAAELAARRDHLLSLDGQEEPV